MGNTGTLEYVHQKFIATRKTGASLHIFNNWHVKISLTWFYQHHFQYWWCQTVTTNNLQPCEWYKCF